MTVPAGDTYAWFATMNFGWNIGSYVGGGRLYYNLDAGAGWQPVTTATGATTTSATFGYDSVRYDLSSLAGKTLHLALQPSSASSNWNEWLVDDFTLYQCLDEAGSPGSVVGELAADRLSADVSWATPEYEGQGITGYEVSVTPTPGSTTVPIIVEGSTSVHLANLDPNAEYVVTVRTIGHGRYLQPGRNGVAARERARGSQPAGVMVGAGVGGRAGAVNGGGARRPAGRAWATDGGAAATAPARVRVPKPTLAAVRMPSAR